MKRLLSFLFASSVLVVAGVSFADSALPMPVQAQAWDGAASVLTGLMAGGVTGTFQRTPSTGLIAGDINNLPPGPCRALGLTMNAIAHAKHIKPEVKRALVPVFLAEAAVFKCELTVGISAGTPASTGTSEMLTVRPGK